MSEEKEPKKRKKVGIISYIMGGRFLASRRAFLVIMLQIGRAHV